MRKAILAVAALALALGCQPPEVEAFRQRPLPIVVKMDVPTSIPGSEAIKREYEAALRSRLATRTTVVVDGAVPPPAAAELRVAVSDIRPARGEPSAAAVGLATGVAVGTLSALLGSRDAAFDGLWWGLWAGTNAAADRRAERRSLGYRPNRISAVAYLVQPASAAPGRPVTLAEFDVSGTEVIESMSRLTPAEQDDPGRIREEEARALARVVVGRLERQFGWSVKDPPSYFGLRRPVEADPDPAPRKESAPPAVAPGEPRT